MIANIIKELNSCPEKKGKFINEEVKGQCQKKVKFANKVELKELDGKSSFVEVELDSDRQDNWELI